MSAHGIFYKKFTSKNILFYTLCLAIVGIVGGNIAYSQKYNSALYGVMAGQVNSSVQYLKHIWGTPLYDMEVDTYKQEGRVDILTEWNKVQQINTQRIQSLEAAAALHPYSPELYYNLYLLYSENGDGVTARANLRKAQQIDPSIR
jgi:hypothetical protein